ncbi:hypothetical protein PVK06_036054 [Gossypium arboreum]|uniref:Uncharacterized protein n=1 Tax=Gossypium arboreum TaxID=29729 RepID=A0ABR0NJD9_GOSAR|nr:hypothetical protein PVK06_036054 [Gossypium arboreum]
MMCEALGLIKGTLWCSSINVRMTNGGMGGEIGKKENEISLRFCHPRLLGANCDMQSSGPYEWDTLVFEYQDYKEVIQQLFVPNGT